MFRQAQKALITSGFTGFIALSSSFAMADQQEAMVELGQHIFNNTALSNPTGQSCASCHAPNTGFTSPEHATNKLGAVVHGAIQRRAGNRKPPTVAYVTYAEDFKVANGRASGGTFWDGRATGAAVTAEIFPTSWSGETVEQFAALLGPSVDQAMGPLLNDVEQNVDGQNQLCAKLAASTPAELWYAAWQEGISCAEADLDTTHKRIAYAIASFEHSDEVSPFNSLWDMATEASLAVNGEIVFPLDGLSDQENQGHEIFDVNCARFCHNGTVEFNGLEKQLFTRPNAGYFNIGVPRNAWNPFYRMNRQRDDNGNIINPMGYAWIDQGLAGRDEDGIEGSDFVGHEGKFKTPTLRNVGKKPSETFVKAYSHNGFFKSLKSMVHFYNTRDMKPVCEKMFGIPEWVISPITLNDAGAMMFGCWPRSEVEENIFACDDAVGDCKVDLPEGQPLESYCDSPNNPRDVGNLCLTEAEEDALVAFLETLSDQ